MREITGETSQLNTSAQITVSKIIGPHWNQDLIEHVPMAIWIEFPTAIWDSSNSKLRGCSEFVPINWKRIVTSRRDQTSQLSVVY